MSDIRADCLNQNKISVPEAALLMGKSQMYLRIGLRNGRFPFGSAVKTGEKNWSYFINRRKFIEYIS